MPHFDSDTKLVAIIGESISHSKSPAMMNAAFRERGLNYYYDIINVDQKKFGTTIKEIAKRNFAGLTLTIPYKIEILKYLDAIDPLAQVIGAVNTVKIENGKMTGYNTDGMGFVNGLESDCGLQAEGNTFFVIGAGGVSRAIMTVLAARKAKAVYLESRTDEKAAALCQHINTNIRDCCIALPHTADFGPYIRQCSTLINASFVGMPPYEQEIPIDPKLLHPALLVADVIYNPPKTRLLQEAEKCGCKIINGQSLLFHQGKIAFKIWTGEDAPADVMRQAVYE